MFRFLFIFLVQLVMDNPLALHLLCARKQILQLEAATEADGFCDLRAFREHASTPRRCGVWGESEWIIWMEKRRSTSTAAKRLNGPIAWTTCTSWRHKPWLLLSAKCSLLWWICWLACIHESFLSYKEHKHFIDDCRRRAWTLLWIFCACKRSPKGFDGICKITHITHLQILVLSG